MLPAHWNTRQQVPDLSELGEWFIEARYPGEWPEPSAADAFTAITQARTVVDLIDADLVSQGLI